MLRFARNDEMAIVAGPLDLLPRRRCPPNCSIAWLLGYLFGSIPFGLMLTRLAGKGDVRDVGSGNIGATNVLRAGGKGLAAATLLLDCLKATAAILLAGRLWPGTESFAAAGALIGHLYPVWLRFKGGKGVATLLGILIPLLPVAAAGLRGGLARPAADGPNLVGRGHGRRGQRADHRCDCSATKLLPNAARFRIARHLETPRRTSSA